MFQGLAANQGVSLIVAQIAGLLISIVLLILFAPSQKKRSVARKK
jgi:hypothetical protein